MHRAVSLLFLTVLFVVAAHHLLDGERVIGAGGSSAASRTGSHRSDASHLLKGIRILGNGFGATFSESRILVTVDGGFNWQELFATDSDATVISDVELLTRNSVRILAADASGGTLRFGASDDGGRSWKTSLVPLVGDDAAEGAPESASLAMRGRSIVVTLPLASSSNFIRTAVYESSDSGVTWKRVSANAVQAVEDSAEVGSADKVGIRQGESVVERAVAAGTEWILTREGTCTGFKNGCYQVSRIHDLSSDGMPREITPDSILGLAEEARRTAELESIAPSAFLPGGSIRTSLNRGFDKCTAATAVQMQTWWDSSPYYDANIYMSGRNRGCTQAQLTASWVNTVSRQGWGLIPTIVGYQSPCSVCSGCQKHSTDPTVAEQEGRAEADIAITDATNLGLLQGTVLYYDMERYDDLSGTGACSTPTKAFLKGWTDRLKERGYVSGVYGSPTNAVADWLAIPQASQPDAVWLARWDNIMSVWTYGAPSPVVPETAWGNHQRIKQWKAPHNDTWGGVTFNIDGNIADGPVAGVQPRNANSDFDGDGKADLAVYRRESGVWYVLTTSNFTFKAAAFGISTDIPVPGDFDGDGQTDFAVWRPENGVWHRFSRSIYTAYQFGMEGDVPVPADFDGDGRTDVAVFRPSNGFWYIKNSLDSKGTSFRFEQFGLSGDMPVPADFDGDGKADLAVFRPSNGVWYMMGSSAGFSAVQFGAATDKSVHADFDGDGKADPAVFRNGVWHILGSRSGYYGFQFGLSDDKPVPADFDGDGKADVAVYRPGNGVWYILGSAQGFFATQFGIASDSPIPAAYTTRN
jgi:hypothetical protein